MAQVLGKGNVRGGGAALAAAAFCALLSGCASIGANPPAADEAVSAVAPLALPGFGIHAPGAPSEVYIRLARQAKACWFAPPAPLVTYVFTADVIPESKGGGANIVIYEHNAGQIHGANAERGLRAYAISLAPSGDATMIGLENDRIPETFAQHMQSDVERWAAGETTCGTSAGWPATAQPGDGTASVKPPGKTPGKSKVWRASVQ